MARKKCDARIEPIDSSMLMTTPASRISRRVGCGNAGTCGG